MLRRIEQNRKKAAAARAAAPRPLIARTVQSRWTVVLALAGFVAVSVAQVTNIILARSNAGVIPPFSLAFFRWLIVAAGLAPFVWIELRAKASLLRSRGWLVVLAGFCGMFVCGGPVYIAGVSTTAINIALIFALSPIVVLIVSWLTGLEAISRYQLLGIALALAGALTIILRGAPARLMSADTVWGDLLVVIAMLGWSGYTLLQSRAARELSFIARVCVFAAVGSLFSLPFAVHEAIAAPGSVLNLHAPRRLPVRGPRARRAGLCGLRLSGRPLRLGAHLAGALHRPGRERAAVLRVAARGTEPDSTARRRADPERRVVQPAEVAARRARSPESAELRFAEACSAAARRASSQKSICR